MIPTYSVSLNEISLFLFRTLVALLRKSTTVAQKWGGYKIRKVHAFLTI